MSLLTCEDLKLGYDGTTVVEHLSFTVDKGDYLCVVGENGSGKSTLIKALLGLNPPIDGKIETGDGLSKNEIGYLPQQTVLQRDFPASVEEIVRSGCLNKTGFRPFYTRQEKEAADYNMKKLGIYEMRKRCYRELSGGQMQRVLLARALGATGRMLLLDEPVAGLDPMATMEMYELVLRLNKEDKITIIMISHDTQASVKYASHILHVSHVPLFFGRTGDYVNSEIGKAFLSTYRKQEETTGENMGGIKRDSDIG